MTKATINVIFAALTWVGVCPYLAGQAASVGRPVAGPATLAIREAFGYTSSVPVAGRAGQNGDEKIVKMEPVQVFAPKNPSPAVVNRNAGMNRFDFSADRKVWSGRLGRFQADLGVLKYEDLRPFGEPTPRWTIFRLKW